MRQWDEVRAKRDRLWRLATILTASVVSVGIPTAIVIAALRY